MDNDEGILARAYDGVSAEVFARVVGATNVVVYDEVTSTSDVAHRLGAQGTPAGTLILADRQTAGRGRNGKTWSSPSGSGIWMTLVERPADRSALEVMSLRVGLAAAAVLDAFAPEPIRLKWPNDLYLGDKKLAGILVEARWRDDRPEWVAIGFGVNVVPPADQPNAAGLLAGTQRVDVLSHLVQELRKAASATGPLSEHEVSAFTARDLARGRRCLEPAQGVVQGITRTGALLVANGDAVTEVRSGSLILE